MTETPETIAMTSADIRVEKGLADPEEVAAITAVLLARAAARPAETPTHRPRPRAAGAAWSARAASGRLTAGTEPRQPSL